VFGQREGEFFFIIVYNSSGLSDIFKGCTVKKLLIQNKIEGSIL
jgi:hypothetical protein